MEKIFIHNNRTAIYCNSPPMEELLRARGDRELTDEELTTYGMKGLGSGFRFLEREVRQTPAIWLS